MKINNKAMKYSTILMSSLMLSCIAGMNVNNINHVNADQINYYVSPNLPENNLNKSYYDLLMSPGQSQTVTIKITNSNPTDKTYDIKALPAMTQNNGQVTYSPSIIEKDSSMKYDLSRLINVENQVTLKSGESKNIEIKVNMPNEQINGVIAGSIVVKEHKSDQEIKDSEKNQTGFGTINEFQYATGFLITQQKDIKIEPIINVGDIKANQSNGRNVVSVHLQNPTQNYINDVSINATITNKKDKNIKYNYSNDQVQFAPTTSFNLAIPISTESGANDQYSEPMKAGKYTLNMTTYANKSENGKYEVKNLDGTVSKYDFKMTTNKDFTISNDEANKYNKTDVTINPSVKKDNKLLYIISGSIVSLIVVITSYIFYRKKKNN